jgi:hypothetical protein
MKEYIYALEKMQVNSFGLNVLKKLPKSCQKGFEENFLKLPNVDMLNEREVYWYGEIDKVVKSIKKNVEDEKSTIPKQMRLANAIYSWVAHNIKYHMGKEDAQAFDLDKYQNAFSIFESKKGIT